MEVTAPQIAPQTYLVSIFAGEDDGIFPVFKHKEPKTCWFKIDDNISVTVFFFSLSKLKLSEIENPSVIGSTYSIIWSKYQFTNDQYRNLNIVLEFFQGKDKGHTTFVYCHPENQRSMPFYTHTKGYNVQVFEPVDEYYQNIIRELISKKKLLPYVGFSPYRSAINPLSKISFRCHSCNGQDEKLACLKNCFHLWAPENCHRGRDRTVFPHCSNCCGNTSTIPEDQGVCSTCSEVFSVKKLCEKYNLKHPFCSGCLKMALYCPDCICKAKKCQKELDGKIRKTIHCSDCCSKSPCTCTAEQIAKSPCTYGEDCICIWPNSIKRHYGGKIPPHCKEHCLIHRIMELKNGWESAQKDEDSDTSSQESADFDSYYCGCCREAHIRREEALVTCETSGPDCYEDFCQHGLCKEKKECKQWPHCKNCHDRAYGAIKPFASDDEEEGSKASNSDSEVEDSQNSTKDKEESSEGSEVESEGEQIKALRRKKDKEEVQVTPPKRRVIPRPEPQSISEEKEQLSRRKEELLRQKDKEEEEEIQVTPPEMKRKHSPLPLLENMDGSPSLQLEPEPEVPKRSKPNKEPVKTAEIEVIDLT